MLHIIRRTAAASALAGVALAVPAFTAAQGRADGYTVTQRVSGDGPQGNLTLKIKVAQGKVRVEMDGGDAVPAGTFMLLRDDGKVTVVLPSQGMAMAMDAGQMANGGMQMMRAFGMEPPSVTGVTVDVTDLGAGETILGYATRKYRVRQQYSITTAMRGMSRTEKHDDVSEIWMTTAMPGYADGLQKFTETMGNAFGGAGQGASSELAAAMAGKMPKGYPLKSVVTSNTTDGNGQAQTTRTTLEVTDVSRGPMELRDFEVPAGIQVIDPMQMMRGRGGS